MKKSLPLFLLLLIAITPGCKGRYRTTFAPGELAPDFTVKNFAGDTESLAKYKGKPILLLFWASWCSECRDEAPTLTRLHEKLSSKGLVILAIALGDSIDGAKDFVDTFKVKYPVGVASDTSINELYRTTGVPEAFVLDREGRFVLLQDPDTRDAATRIVGPRAWDSPSFVEQIQKLL